MSLKEGTDFGKLYPLPKIHERFHYVPGRLVNSNCGCRTEMCSEFLDDHLKTIIQNGWSYIEVSVDFINKTNTLELCLTMPF